jgi:hypothetical protein
MSELNDRMGTERGFAKRLSRLTSRQRRELRDLLGDPPDVRRVSAADWQRWEDERRKELTLILLAIFLATLRQHVDEMVPGAMDDSTTLAVNREALVKAGALAADSAASTISTARDIVTASAEVIATGTKADIDAVLVSALGPERDAITAATATTAAQSAGTNAARLPLEMAGYNLVTRWYTERDGNVCPLCSALDGKSTDLWGPVLEQALGPGGTRAIASIVEYGGPPAHPYCRCYLQTKAEPVARRVRVAG